MDTGSWPVQPDTGICPVEPWSSTGGDWDLTGISTAVYLWNLDFPSTTTVLLGAAVMDQLY